MVVKGHSLLDAGLLMIPMDAIKLWGFQTDKIMVYDKPLKLYI